MVGSAAAMGIFLQAVRQGLVPWAKEGMAVFIMHSEELEGLGAGVFQVLPSCHVVD